MRLAQPLYESLPVIYLLIGAGLLFCSYRLHSGAWSVLLLVVGLIGLVGGVAVWLRRRDFRAAGAQYGLRGARSAADDEALR
jgi:hypothetical protein